MRHTTTFTANLRRARRYFGITQKEAARRVQISYRTYQAYEEGRAQPNAEILIRIAETYDIYNLLQFLKNPDFDLQDQDKLGRIVDNPMLVLYRKASPRTRSIVEFVLKTGAA